MYFNYHFLLQTQFRNHPTSTTAIVRPLSLSTVNVSLSGMLNLFQKRVLHKHTYSTISF